MNFSTWFRGSILVLGIAACGGNGSGGGSTGVTSAPSSAGGPFEGQGTPGPFGATNSNSNVVGTYATGGPFEGQGAAGSFGVAEDCKTYCARVASVICSGTQMQSGNDSSSVATTCEKQCRDTLSRAKDATCLNVLTSFLNCLLTAELTCAKNGAIQAPDCSTPNTLVCESEAEDSPGVSTDGGR